MGPSAGLDALEKRKLSPALTRIEPQIPFCSACGLVSTLTEHMSSSAHVICMSVPSRRICVMRTLQECYILFKNANRPKKKKKRKRKRKKKPALLLPSVKRAYMITKYLVSTSYNKTMGFHVRFNNGVQFHLAHAFIRASSLSRVM